MIVMTTTAACPYCEAQLDVDDPKKGDEVDCQDCDIVLTVSQTDPLVFTAEDEDEDDFEDEDDDDDDWEEDEDDDD